MKKILTTLILLSIVNNIFAQGAMIVVDQTSFIQRATQFAEEMAEMAEQKMTMFEQVKKAQESAEFMKKEAKKFQQVMSWVKEAREAILIIEDIQKMAKNINSFRDALILSPYLTEDEQLQFYSMALSVYEKTDKCVQDIKTYTTSFKNEEETGLESADRKFLLEDLRKYTKELISELNNVRKLAQTISDKREQQINSHIIIAKTLGFKTKEKSLVDFINKNKK